MKKPIKQTKKTPEFDRPVDRYFYELDKVFGNQKIGFYVCGLSLLFFGVMGLIWMVPFPQLDFLVKMKAHTFLNWGSFFIAIVVYCYLKLAPTLSYAMLFCIGIMSYFIVQLEYVERDGGPSVILVSAIFAIAGIAFLLFAVRKRNADMNSLLKLIAIGPIWLWSKAFDWLKWKY